MGITLKNAEPKYAHADPIASSEIFRNYSTAIQDTISELKSADEMTNEKLYEIADEINSRLTESSELMNDITEKYMQMAGELKRIRAYALLALGMGIGEITGEIISSIILSTH